MHSQLAHLDLKLLIAFRALMEERNVTHAAEKLSITQPAMSKILHRLREVFEDPLFTRSKLGLVPTPVAEDLYGPITVMLDDLDRLVSRSSFTPGKATGSIRIAAPDAVSVAVIPGLFQRFCAHAPHVRLFADHLGDDHLELLASGKHDFSIFLAADHGPNIRSMLIGSSPNVCWMRRGHPLSDRSALTIADVSRYPRASLDPHNFKFTSPDILKTLEIYRRAGLMDSTYITSAQFLTTLAVVHQSDALILAPALLSKHDLVRGQFVYKPVHEVVGLELKYYLFQHRRTWNSPLHNWVCEQVLATWADSPQPGESASRRALRAV